MLIPKTKRCIYHALSFQKHSRNLFMRARVSEVSERSKHMHFNFSGILDYVSREIMHSTLSRAIMHSTLSANKDYFSGSGKYSSKYFNFWLFADYSNLFHTFKLNERNIDLGI